MMDGFFSADLKAPRSSIVSRLVKARWKYQKGHSVLGLIKKNGAKMGAIGANANEINKKGI
jgi:hypothetical protein